MSKWISVNDKLPTDAIDCWVWSEDWGEDACPEIDSWIGGRGEIRQWADGEMFINSGWYGNCGKRITHWMPVEYPKPPKMEVGEDERD